MSDETDRARRYVLLAFMMAALLWGVRLLLDVFVSLIKLALLLLVVYLLYLAGKIQIQKLLLF